MTMPQASGQILDGSKSNMQAGKWIGLLRSWKAPKEKAGKQEGTGIERIISNNGL
jgi:hypothetical protein